MIALICIITLIAKRAKSKPIEVIDTSFHDSDFEMSTYSGISFDISVISNLSRNLSGIEFNSDEEISTDSSLTTVESMDIMDCYALSTSSSQSDRIYDLSFDIDEFDFGSVDEGVSHIVRSIGNHNTYTDILLAFFMILGCSIVDIDIMFALPLALMQLESMNGILL